MPTVIKCFEPDKSNFFFFFFFFLGLPWWFSGRESTCQCRRHRFDPWLGNIPWKRKWQPLQYSCLENPLDKGARWATLHGVTKDSDTTEAILQNAMNVLLSVILKW